MANFLNILILEDVKSDALLIEYQLKKARFKFKTMLVKTKPDFLNALQTFKPDLILSDYNLPGFSGTEVLEICKEKIPEIPFIFVTGYLDENIAVNFIHKGAWDYVLKENYVRLIPAIENSIKLRNERIKVKLASDFLKTSKKRYQDLYEHAPDMYLTINFETALIIECNETIAKATGFLKSEIINRSVYSFYPYETSNKITNIIIPYLLQNGKVENAELDLIKKDQSIISGLVNINADFNNLNKIVSLRVVIRDISYKKKQEKALIESEERFKTIFNKSEDPIIILDYSDNEIPVIKDINTNLLTKIGYSKKDVIGKPINIIVPDITKEEIKKHTNNIANGITFRDKVTVDLKSIQTFYFDVVGSLISLNKKKYILISARDISKKHLADLKLIKEKEKIEALSEAFQEQNEDLYESVKQLALNKRELKNKLTIINRSPAVSISWKNMPGWPIEHVSENTVQIFGYTAKDFKSGKVKYADLIHPDDLNRVINEVAESSNGITNKVTHKSYRILTKNNTIKWVKDDTIIIRKNGKATHFEGIITDNTETVINQNLLRISKNKYKTILESNPDMILISSEKKVLEYLNPQAEKKFGKNLIGTTCYKSIFGLSSPCNWCGNHKVGNNKKKSQEIQNPKNNRRYIISYSKFQNEDRTNSYISVYKDVTQLREVQAEKLRFLKTLEAGLNEIYIFDSETYKFQYVNKRAIDNLGYTKNEILKLNPKIINPGLNEIALNNLIKPLKTGKTKKVKFETTLRRKNGTDYPVEISLQIIKQDNKYVFLGVANDISSKIETDETIKKLSTAINQSPITIVITDTKGNIEFANPKFEEITGYTLKEVIGQNPRVLKSGYQDNFFYEELWATISKGKVWEGEFYNKKKDGSFYWEKASISPVKNTAGIITHYIALKEDITETKRIREELIQSEIHFRKLFENSVIGMYLTTPSGEIIEANQALCDMLEYENSDELKVINLEIKKDQSPGRSTFKAIIEKENLIVGFESIWKTKTGKKINVRESARKYLDEAGNVFYEGTVENITKQKLADKALKEIHTFNKKIIKIGKLGFATYNKIGECLTVNESFAEILGESVKDLLGKNFNENQTWKTNGLIEKSEKCLAEGSNYKTMIDTKSGFNKNIWVEIHISRIYKDEKVELLLIIKDISSFVKAKKRQFQSKAEYFNLIANVNVPIFGIKTEGIVSEWNGSLEKLTGFTKKQIKGKTLISLVEDPKSITVNKFIKDTDLGSEITNFEINFKTKHQNTLKLLISTTIRRDIYNNIDGIVCVGQDITKIHQDKEELEKRVEERTHKLIEALQKEKELGDLKSQFVSMASHEFRTPLAAISFASGFVKKYWTRIDEQKRNLKLEKIDTQVKHMTSLLNDVLTFGKTESGKIKFEPKETNLINFLNEIIEEVQNASGNSHQIKLNYKNGVSMIMLDEKIGRNIFTNLLTNAIKFSPDADYVSLNINSSETEVQIEIIDKGIGINQNELEHIFTPFHRGQNVSTIQGTGLGLAIVKESIDIMKGTISAESEVKKGTKFKIILPKYN